LFSSYEPVRTNELVQEDINSASKKCGLDYTRSTARCQCRQGKSDVEKFSSDGAFSFLSTSIIRLDRGRAPTDCLSAACGRNVSGRANGADDRSHAKLWPM